MLSPSNLKMALLDYVSKTTSILLLKSGIAGVYEKGKEAKTDEGDS